MSLQKTTIPIDFSSGLDTKTDSKQVQIGKFLSLQNSVFTKPKRLSKRNGYPILTSLPDTAQTTLTAYKETLVATGSSMYAYNAPTRAWGEKGSIQPVQLSTQAVLRSSSSQIGVDMAVAPSGLGCLVYRDASLAYYQLTDTASGQQVVGRTALPSTAAKPRVFLLGNYFIITFLATVAAATHLRYIAIPTAQPNSPSAATDISTSVASLASGYDGYSSNGRLFLAWEGGASDFILTYLSNTLLVAAAVTLTSHSASNVTVAADVTGSTPVVWAAWWSSTSGNDGYAAAFDFNLTEVLAPTEIITATAINELTSVAADGTLTFFYSNNNNYNSTGAYPSAVRTDYVSRNTITTAASVGTAAVVMRSVGLASKAFINDAQGVTYMWVTYGETNQPTYFLIDSTGAVCARSSYSNGGGYISGTVLTNVPLVNDTYYFPHLVKTLLAPVNKGTDLPSGTPVNTIFTQTGVNLTQFSINTTGQYSAEIAECLHLTGGMLWQYDGVKPVEHGFHVWPENVASATATGAGGLTAQDYYYAFCYEWTDNQGNLHRSAPSIPLKQATTTGSSTNTLYVPTLRITYKTTPNPVRIVGYRWSAAQPVYYQFTSVTSPTLNNPSVDYVTITDANADSAILGQTLLYTTGGVVENIAAPAAAASTLFKNRLFLIDAENPNLLWYSKQVIQGTPVEMSDLFTMYVAPTTGAQGPTGGCKALSTMDDKLIIFKKSAIYYQTGIGPDNTGNNNDFSDPVYIPASVGCDNPSSVVLTPLGLMFQSEKGIWLLGRDLSTKYIGAPVEEFNSYTVRSATSIPGTNEVRFILSNNTALVYDCYVDQWGTFTNTAAVSATLYDQKHTYLNAFGQVLQETDGTYIDGSRPVLLSFKTGWVNAAGLQGYERLYFLHLLGTYKSPFKLIVQIAYDYNPSPSQSIVVTPDSHPGDWGDEAVWGGGAGWGGTGDDGDVFFARIFPEKQKCQAFQLIVNEVRDSSVSAPVGEGLSLSGMALTIGVKKGYRTQKASQSFG